MCIIGPVMKKSSVINNYKSALSSLVSPLTKSRRIQILTSLFNADGGFAGEMTGSVGELIQELCAAYYTAAPDRKMLTVLDAFCGYSLTECQLLREDFAESKVLLSSDGYGAWLFRRYDSQRSIEDRVATIDKLNRFLGDRGLSLWGEIGGRSFLAKMQLLKETYIQLLADGDGKLLLRLYELCAYAFHAAYGQRVEEYAKRMDDAAAEAGVSVTEFQFGDGNCPFVAIYSDKAFRHSLQDWLISHKNMGSGTAHNYIGAITTFCKSVNLPEISIFRCGTIESLQKALSLLLHTDLSKGRHLAKIRNLSVALNNLKEYLHTHRPLDLDDPEIGGKVRRLLRNSFGGSIEESPHAFSRFQNSWRADFGEDCPLENEQIRDFVKHMCAFDNRDKNYRLPEIAMPHELLQEVGTYIEDKYLKKGKPFVQLGAIAAQFNRMYPQEPAFQTIGNESAAQFLYELLQKALPSDFKFSYRCQGGRYYVSSSAPDGTPFPDDVGTYLDRVIGQYVYEMTERTGEPVPQEDLMREFDFVSPDRLETVLSNCTPSLVKLPHGRFLHYSSFALQGELLQTFRDRLVDELRNHPGGIANEELLDFAQQYAPELLQNPATPEALRSLMKNPAIFYRVFKTNWLDDSDLEFAKKNKVTLKGRKTKTHLEDCEDFVKSHRSFTLEELSNIRAGVGVSNYVLQSIRRFSVRLDEQNFVARDAVEFPVQELDAVLGKLMSGRETLRFSELNDFSGFPQVPGFRWTPFLLHHFLCEVSEQYIFVSSAERIKTPQGLIVRRASSIATFPKALAAYLETNDCFRGCNDEEQIREMLVAQKLISRKYEGLAEVLSMVSAYLGFGCTHAPSASSEAGSSYAVVE